MSAKIIRGILAVMLCMLFAVACGGGGGGGGGKSGNVYTEISAEDLETLILGEIGADCSGDFRLDKNYSVTGEWTGICLPVAGGVGGAGAMPGYAGIFDGDGHTIKFNDDVIGGLFATIAAGTVMNLNIIAEKDINGLNEPIFGGEYAGGISGAVSDDGVIEACSVTVKGDISITSADTAYIGGITGVVTNGGTIADNRAVVHGSVSATNDDFAYSGGIAGWLDDAQLNNNYAVVYGDISAEGDNVASSGGIAGIVLGSELYNNYAVAGGSVSAAGASDTNAGGLAGWVTTGTIEDNVAVVNSINATGSLKNLGRIWGGADVALTAGNNRAFKGGSDAAAKNGLKVTKADLATASWWGSPATFTTASGWVTKDGDFPIQKYFKDNGLTATKLADFSAWLHDDGVPSTEISAEELKTLILDEIGADCSGDFTLTDNYSITGEWTGICLPDGTITGYKGTFDGDNYTIKFNDNVTGGFFAYIKGGTVKNLNIIAEENIKGLYISTGGECAGGISGAIEQNAKIDACSVTVMGDIVTAAPTSIYSTYFGGLTGWITGSGNITNSRVVVHGSISATANNNANVGGIVGWANPGSYTNNYAIVYGDISASANTTAYAGGIAGIAINNITFANNYAVVGGKISATGTGSTTTTYAGGLVGRAGITGALKESVSVVNVIEASGGTTNDSGRVWGFSTSPEKASNNRAFKGGNDLAAKDGLNVTKATLATASWWGSTATFSTANGWVTTEGEFPIQEHFKDNGLTATKLADFSAWLKD